MVWRRFLLASETSLADLHEVLQLAFGWSGFYFGSAHETEKIVRLVQDFEPNGLGTSRLIALSMMRRALVLMRRFPLPSCRLSPRRGKMHQGPWGHRAFSL
jgi:hypothetical protein